MDLERNRVRELKQLANESRRLIVESAYHTGATFPSGALSPIEILVALYFEILNSDPTLPDWYDRDRVVFSKSHALVSLHAVLALRGFFRIAELNDPTAAASAASESRAVPGVDLYSGCPAQGLSLAVGIALGAKLRKNEFRTFALIGDGEAQQGQMWEAALIAVRYQLDHLVGILDGNGLQQYGWPGTRGYRFPERMRPLDNPRAKWEALGWYVLEIDGHSFQDIASAVRTTRQVRGRPTMIIARTVKGKGISFMEGRYDWHARHLSESDRNAALEELESEAARL